MIFWCLICCFYSIFANRSFTSVCCILNKFTLLQIFLCTKEYVKAFLSNVFSFILNSDNTNFLFSFQMKNLWTLLFITNITVVIRLLRQSQNMAIPPKTYVELWIVKSLNIYKNAQRKISVYLIAHVLQLKL